MGALIHVPISLLCDFQRQQPPCNPQTRHWQQVAERRHQRSWQALLQHQPALLVISRSSIGNILLGSVSVAALFASSSEARPLLVCLREQTEQQSHSVVSAASLIRTETAFAVGMSAAVLAGSSAARLLLVRLRANSRSSDSAVLAVKWLINYLIWFRGLNTDRAPYLYSAIVPFEIVYKPFDC